MKENTLQPKNLTVCAGIVLYNPDPERLLQNVGAVLPQVGRVIAVDNSSFNFSDIRRLLDDAYPDEITWILNGKNQGIAFALNQLTDAADEIGYPWLLTLDQDSVCSEGLVGRLLDAAGADPSIAMVSPYIVDVNLMSLADYQQEEHPKVEDVPMCITSGCLTSVSIVKNLGGFNNDLFIDQVDHEMCIRIRRAGHKVVRANHAWLLHEVGKSRELHLLPALARFSGNKWLSRPKYISNHSPMRVFYQTRNLLYLLRTYPGCMGIPNGRYWAGYCRGVALKLMKEPQKAQKLSAFLRGAWEGWKFGKSPKI